MRIAATRMVSRVHQASAGQENMETTRPHSVRSQSAERKTSDCWARPPKTSPAITTSVVSTTMSFKRPAGESPTERSTANSRRRPCRETNNTAATDRSAARLASDPTRASAFSTTETTRQSSSSATPGMTAATPPPSIDSMLRRTEKTCPRDSRPSQMDVKDFGTSMAGSMA